MRKNIAQAKNMILGQIYTNEVTDARILQVMTDIDRDQFVPASLHGAAYVDEDLPLGNGRFMLAPLTLAKLLNLTGIAEPSRVLVIGAYNGYVAALAAKLAHHVVATDINSEALDIARVNLQRLHLKNVDLQAVKSLADGYALSAPYDVILVPGAVEHIPESLGSQLGINGRLACVRNVAERPGIAGGLGKGVLVTRVGGHLQYREHFDASSPLLPGFKDEPAFSL